MTHPSRHGRWLVPLALLVLACTPPDRAPGERAPLTAACDAADPLRCGLPWPSDTFTVADASTATGLRVAATDAVLPIADDLDAINGADGFSPLNPMVTGFDRPVATESLAGPLGGALRLFVSEPGAAFAREEPVSLRVVAGDGGASLVVALPLRPLSFASEHVVVVTDALRFTDGTAPGRDRIAGISLGFVTPADDDESARARHDAPIRLALAAAGVDLEHVVRAWTWTTRSHDDVRRRLAHMQARAVESLASAHVTLTSVELPAEGPVAAIVEGMLEGLPQFRVSVPGVLRTAPDGLPVDSGTTAAPFRAVLPKGEGTFRAVLYGHGTSGNVHDDAFDTDLAAKGIGKVGVRWDGWTDTTAVQTFTGFTHMLGGVRASTAGLMQSLAEARAIEAALDGLLGDTLSAATFIVEGRTLTNPAAGRRIDTSIPVWTGGSLGGCMGFVFANTSPAMRHAVLNVPGAGWTHFLPQSGLFEGFLPLFLANVGDPLDLQLTVAMSQLAWDEVDGANLVPDDATYLVQQSIGDPVLHASGTALVAASLGAVQVGAVLEPVFGVTPVSAPVHRTALTQFRTDATSASQVHGFAATSRPAGVAAREQIVGYLDSVFDGDATIAVPARCTANTPAGSCDFSTAD